MSQSRKSLYRGKEHYHLCRCHSTLSSAVGKVENKSHIFQINLKNLIDNCTSGSAPSPWFMLTAWLCGGANDAWLEFPQPMARLKQCTTFQPNRAVGTLRVDFRKIFTFHSKFVVVVRFARNNIDRIPQRILVDGADILHANI